MIKNKIEISKGSLEFLNSLLSKAGSSIIASHKSIVQGDGDDPRDFKRVSETIDANFELANQIGLLADIFDVTITPHDGGDEDLLTVDNLNKFCIEMYEMLMSPREMDMEIGYTIHSMRVARDIYKLILAAEEEIDQSDNIIMSSALSSYELDSDIEEVEKYISMFSGEEYDDGGESN